MSYSSVYMLHTKYIYIQQNMQYAPYYTILLLGRLLEGQYAHVGGYDGTVEGAGAVHMLGGLLKIPVYIYMFICNI